LSAVVGALRRVWFNDGMTNPRYYDLPKSTLDPRYETCADHHPACDCREATIAENHDELLSENRAMYRAIREAVKGHMTYAADAYGMPDEFAMCKCAACGIARKAHVGYWEWKAAREANDARAARAHWLRANRPATLAPRYPYTDIEVPF